MFGISMWELLIVGLILFVVVGPAKLPGLAKSIGKGLKDLRKGLQGVKETVDTDDEFVKAVREARQTVVEAKQSLQSFFDDEDDVPDGPDDRSGPLAEGAAPRTGARGRPQVQAGRGATEEVDAPPPVTDGPELAAGTPEVEDFHRPGPSRPVERPEAVPREPRKKRPMITPGRPRAAAPGGDPDPDGQGE